MSGVHLLWTLLRFRQEKVLVSMLHNIKFQPQGSQVFGSYIRVFTEEINTVTNFNGDSQLWQVSANSLYDNRKRSKVLHLSKHELKGQLQRFHKLISNDRIWPSEQVIFEKSLFVFEISAFKVRNKCGSILGFTRLIIIGKTFVCDVTSDQSSMISTERSDLRDRKASGNC